MLEIFLDTADIDEIREAVSWGIVDGVTTNPSLIKKAMERRKGKSGSMEDYIKEMCRSVDGPVSLEVISLTSEKMVQEARILYKKFNPVNKNVVVKIPINTNSKISNVGDYEGLKALKALSEEGIPTNATLVMSPEQALLAAKAGADYVSPFTGRVDDYIRANLGLKRGEDYQKGDYHDSEWLKQSVDLSLIPKRRDLEGKSVGEIYMNREVREIMLRSQDNGIYCGVEVIKSVRKIFSNYDIESKIIAASMRNARQVREAAEAGADVITIPFKVLQEMLRHHKTSEGVVNFTKDVIPEYKAIFKS